jgi:hypothetical protein
MLSVVMVNAIMVNIIYAECRKYGLYAKCH